ncbi:MAG: cytochrome c biogenesis protein CcsA [Betaproteobacteria bacterium]|nr:cytochrome c biogenesis protein CcsA [Betaproteobacteria bacterium]
MIGLRVEVITLWLGLGCYAAGALLSWQGAIASRRREAAVLMALCAGLLILASAIAQRWVRLGHGPFFNMFEVLASNLFSLGLIYTLVYWRAPRMRATARIVMPILLVMALWLWSIEPIDSHFPATYATPILWFHVLLGKVFLGCSLIALGISGAVILRRFDLSATWFTSMPADALLDAIAWRVMQAALIFESAMLIMGALWAQDAWGRYWAWDPLETWAFITWLALAGALHLRITYRVSPFHGALMISAVFAIAFLTFFGVPFVTLAPHKGAV